MSLALTANGGQWSSGSYTIIWAVDPTQTFVTFTMSVTGTGWIGMGYSLIGPAHTQSQMIVGWVSGGVTTLYDGFANSKRTEANGVTTISFQKPIKASFANSLDIPNGNVIFQYAYHSTQDGSGGSFPRHQTRGFTSLNLLAVAAPTTASPAAVATTTVSPVPAASTTASPAAVATSTVSLVPLASTTVSPAAVATTTVSPVPAASTTASPVLAAITNATTLPAATTKSSPAPAATTTASSALISTSPSPTATASASPPPSVIISANGGQWSSGSYTIIWAVDPTQTFVTFTMSVTGTGWVGMGYSLIGPAHTQSQMIVGWVSGGITTLYDGFANSQEQPTKNAQSSLTLISGTEANGVTTISFQKPIKSSFANSLDIPIGSVFFQYAYHSTQDGSEGSFPEHQIRGSESLNFFATGSDANRTISGSGKSPTDIKFPELQSNVVYDTTNGGILLLIISVLIILYSIVHYTREFIKSRFVPYPKRNVEVSTPFLLTNLKLKERLAFHQIHNVLNQRVPFLESPWTDVLVFIFYVFLAAGSVFLWGPVNEPINTALGYITSVNSILVVITGLKNSILMWFLEIPFDRAIGFHRLLGYFAYVVVTVHGILYLIQWDTTILLQLQSNTSYLFGVIAWACFTVLIIGSLPYFRRGYFNSFYHTHIALFLGFFFCGYMHSDYFTNYGVGFLVLYGLDRMVRFGNGLFPRKTILIEHLPGDAVKIRFQKAMFLKKYQVGQYVFVSFPGFKFFEWHPFTISSSPSEEYCEIVIRGLGEFTNSIVDFAKNNRQQNIYIRVDGPYGKWPFNFKRYKTVVLIAGGVGVTPCISMIREAFHKNAAAHNIELVYLIWSCPDKTNLTWFETELESIEQMAAKNTKFIKGIYLTRAKELPKNVTGVSLGRPNIESLFKSIYIRECEERQGIVSRVAVISCGPAALV